MVRFLSPIAKILMIPMVFLLVAPPVSVAAPKHDFSGEYTLVASRGAFKFHGAAWVLHITQTDSSIEIVKDVDRQKCISKFKLDGSEGVYTASSGQQGPGKAQMRGHALIIDGTVTHLESTNTGMLIHSHEKWELSGDGKTLTVNVHVDFPKSALEGYNAIEPWTEIYARN